MVKMHWMFIYIYIYINTYIYIYMLRVNKFQCNLDAVIGGHVLY